MKLARRIGYILLSFTVTAFFLPINPRGALVVYADRFGLDNAARGTNFQKDINLTIGGIIEFVLGFVGVIFLIMIIAGGIMWMTSGGNEQRVEKAKKIITTSAIGLAVVLAGYAIAYWLISALTTATQPSAVDQLNCPEGTVPDYVNNVCK